MHIFVWRFRLVTGNPHPKWGGIIFAKNKTNCIIMSNANIILTLDERMRQDFGERLQDLPISAAVNLSPVAKMRDPGSTTGFSKLGLPGFFCGNRDAETVVVNLNPGMDAGKADSLWGSATGSFDKSNIESFIEDYSKSCRDYGINDASRYDEFDIKQAAFWVPWSNSGINFQSHIDWKNRNDCLIAKTIVLTYKLQLELVPYASSKFSINKNQIRLFYPFIRSLLDEIFRKKRTYVVFASAIFEQIFEAYNHDCSTIFEGLSNQNESVHLIKNDGTMSSKSFNCKVIRIHFNGTPQKALIAHSFPRLDIGKAFSMMEQYGEFCHRVWKNSPF